MEKIKKFFKNVGYLLYKYRFIWKRIGFAIVSLLFAVVLTFFVLNLIPNDSIDEYAMKLASERNISLEEAHALAISILGYDPNESIFIKLLNYLNNLLRGNLGTSIRFLNVSANSVIAQFLPYTLFISTLALIISFIIGIKMGSSMASNKSKAKEIANTSFILISSSIPDYIWAILLLYVFATKLKWFPLSGARLSRTISASGKDIAPMEAESRNTGAGSANGGGKRVTGKTRRTGRRDGQKEPGTGNRKQD